MTKTLPLQSNSSAKNNFFNNFVVESLDQNGRTSLRQIVSTDTNGRQSILNAQAAQDQLASSHGASGPSLRFVRKSELSHDIYSNKSVISIKGEAKGDVKIKYGASE